MLPLNNAGEIKSSYKSICVRAMLPTTHEEFHEGRRTETKRACKACVMYSEEAPYSEKPHNTRA